MQKPILWWSYYTLINIECKCYTHQVGLKATEARDKTFLIFIVCFHFAQLLSWVTFIRVLWTTKYVNIHQSFSGIWNQARSHRMGTVWQMLGASWASFFCSVTSRIAVTLNWCIKKQLWFHVKWLRVLDVWQTKRGRNGECRVWIS